jgi:hypothetical protein
LAAHCHSTIVIHHDSLLPSPGHALPHAALAVADDYQRVVAEAVSDLSEGRARLLSERVTGRELLENAGLGSALVRECIGESFVASVTSVLASVAEAPLMKPGGVLILLVRGAETPELDELERYRALLELRFSGERAILGWTPASGRSEQRSITAMMFPGRGPRA